MVSPELLSPELRNLCRNLSIVSPELGTSGTPELILNDKNGGHNIAIQCVCMGNNDFIKFWEFNPDACPAEGIPRRVYETWHAYELAKMAPGYFLHNLVTHIFPGAAERAEQLWFPAEGKECSLDCRKKRE
jgi:hypothetical protein